MLQIHHSHVYLYTIVCLADSCDNNPCQALPCANGGSCIMASSKIHLCLCQKGFTGNFRFRTDETSGLLLFQGGRGPTVQNEYVAVAIRGGYLELSYNLGRQYEENLLLAKSSVYVSDGNWHTAFVRM
ncbi:hypothetical protein DPMN_119283 [Dreissena polymorpha]|uniref:Uncharacterized protein n=1 Tax=Dreissena polymorpha TaxID=45954 RepID=A0A9D4JR47_DREPO|nr:hypothetical protein DPMN_119283 [Dreissena polymorpha]